MVNKEKLQSILQHPDFSVIPEILEDYLKPLLDIKDMDTTQDPATVKAELIARMRIHKQITNLLQDLGILKKVLERQPTTMK